MDGFTKKWTELTESDVARTQYGEWEEREVGGPHRFIVKHNEGHWGKKRGGRHAPQKAEVVSGFNSDAFNFLKITPQEIIGSVDKEGTLTLDSTDSTEGLLIFNVSPMFAGHSLITPYPQRKYPQVMVKPGLEMALNFIQKVSDPLGRLVFNSLGAFASVNHLHFHYLCQRFPVENCSVFGSVPGRNHLFKMFTDYPTVVLVVQTSPVDPLMGFLEFLTARSIPFNLLFTPKTVYIFPRKNQVHNVGVYRMAVAEVSGCPIVQNREEYTNITDEAYSRSMAEEICPEDDTLREIWNYFEGL